MLVWTGWLRIEYDYFISMMMAFFIYLVGYTGYLKPEIISSLPGLEKYSSSSLSKKTSKLLTEKVLQFMKEQKPFVNSELKLHDLATQLSLKPHQLSQIINENLHQNFSDFINQYRVNLAKSMLTQHDNGRIKLIEIAYDCGFNNKVSFNNAFKKMEGISPSAYLKKIQAFSN